LLVLVTGVLLFLPPPFQLFFLFPFFSFLFFFSPLVFSDGALFFFLRFFVREISLPFFFVLLCPPFTSVQTPPTRPFSPPHGIVAPLGLHVCLSPLASLLAHVFKHFFHPSCYFGGTLTIRFSLFLPFVPRQFLLSSVAFSTFFFLSYFCTELPCSSPLLSSGSDSNPFFLFFFMCLEDFFPESISHFPYPDYSLFQLLLFFSFSFELPRFFPYFFFS